MFSTAPMSIIYSCSAHNKKAVFVASVTTCPKHWLYFYEAVFLSLFGGVSHFCRTKKKKLLLAEVGVLGICSLKRVLCSVPVYFIAIAHLLEYQYMYVFLILCQRKTFVCVLQRAHYQLRFLSARCRNGSTCFMGA